jgi:hypothetical protein
VGAVPLPLAAGCNNVTLTYPDGTALAKVARYVLTGPYLIPSPLPEAIWRYDNAAQRFLGWSPNPSAPNDFDQVNRLDTVFICVRGASALYQPPA